MTPTTLIAAGVLMLILLPIIVIDLQERRIPNVLNALLAAAGLVFDAVTAPSLAALLRGLGAAVAIVLLFVGLIALMRLLKRPGTLGLGDVKFLGAAGIWVGFVGSTLVFVVASLLALAFTVTRAPWRKLDLKAPIPFSPFLAVGLALIFAISVPWASKPASLPAAAGSAA